MANGHGGARVGTGHKTQIVTEAAADYFVEYSGAYGDLMYDGYTHNPLGRLFKVGFKYGS